MIETTLKLLAGAFAVLVAGAAAATALRSARRLNARIREFKAEQEAVADRPGPRNPYEAMAELYAENADFAKRPRALDPARNAAADED